MTEKYIGEVVFFKPEKQWGYGFISRPGEKDIFVHWSDIEVEGFKTLKKGQKVAFSIGVNRKGDPKATNVVVIEDASSKK